MARLYLILRITGAIGCVLAAIALGISVYALYYIVEKMTMEHSQYSSHIGRLYWAYQVEFLKGTKVNYCKLGVGLIRALN